MSDKRVTFYANGPDNWIRRDWAKQCAGEVFMGTGRCQGIINHEGSCWAYSPAGWLLKADEAYSSQIPPGHTTYVSPVDMQDKCYQHKYDDSAVTDPDEIARLNRGELLVGESMLRQAKIEPDSFEEGAEDE